eukprot:910335_1
MLASLLLVVSCIILQRVVLDKVIDGDRLEFSGNNLIQNRQLWVLITASMIHATLGHEVNNLLFTFVVSYAAEIQFSLSPLWLLMVFTLSGSIGWIASFTYHYIKHKELAFFIPSRGYSPNMYGGAFFCCIVYSKVILNNVLRMHPVLWMLSIIILPTYCSDHKNHNPFVWSGICVVICITTMLIYNHTSLLKDITMGGFLSLYFIKCLINYWYSRKVLGRTSFFADHACHLGGSIGGILLGILYLYINNKSWPFYRVDATVWIAITQWDFIFPFGMLWFRLLNNM